MENPNPSIYFRMTDTVRQIVYRIILLIFFATFSKQIKSNASARNDQINPLIQ